MINNDFYDDLQEKWYTAKDHPIALLRAENAFRVPWMVQEIRNHFRNQKCKVLDIGCGAGFTTNVLAKHGHDVTGIDLSGESLEVAKRNDKTRSVRYVHENAYSLSFDKGFFDVVCAMDFLEHVDNPKKIVEEAAKVLRPGGIFFFHTFNRNLWSYLFAIKGVELFVKNTPKDMHVLKMFIKPKELENYCMQFKLKVKEMKGLTFCLNKAFWKMIVTRCVPDNFRFKPTPSLKLGYFGMAIREGANP